MPSTAHSILHVSSHVIPPAPLPTWVDVPHLVDMVTGVIQDAKLESGNAELEVTSDACDHIFLFSKVELIKLSTSLGSFRML